jgi:hypothetical protein
VVFVNLKKEIMMNELTIISTLMNDPKNNDKPAVQIGLSQHPPEKSKSSVLGPYLTSQAEIDGQIDDLITQLESARKDAKKYIETMNQ